MNRRPGYSKEVRERAVRLVKTREHDHSSRWAATQSVVSKIVCASETLRSWIRKIEVDAGGNAGVTNDHAEQMKTLERTPERRRARAKRDAYLVPEIRCVREKNHRNDGARKVWQQLKRESVPVARCTVEQLMKKRGIEGVRPGRRCITTIPSETAYKVAWFNNRRLHPISNVPPAEFEMMYHQQTESSNVA